MNRVIILLAAIALFMLWDPIRSEPSAEGNTPFSWIEGVSDPNMSPQCM